MRGVLKKAAIATIAAAAIGLAAGAVMPWPSTDEPSISITSVNGTDVRPGRVTVGEEIAVYPEVISSDGKIHDAAERPAINAGLLNARVLRDWSLCAVELKATAEMIRGYADAIYAFPQDKPLNDAGSEGSVTAEDAVRAQRARVRADRYDIAARLAERAKIPCTKQGQALDIGNYAALRVSIGSDKRVTLNVPDYSVAGSSLLEYTALRNNCEPVLVDKLERAKASVVDATRGDHGFLDTYTERSKAEAIVTYSAQIEMVRASGMNIPCK